MSANDKVATLTEAAALIEDGTLIALGGGERGQPTAIAAELIRQGRRGLRLTGCYHGFAKALLIRSGCGGTEDHPSGAARGEEGSPAEGNSLTSSDEIALERFRAAAMGLLFLPIADRIGDEVGAASVTDPHTGAAVRTVAALHPDIAVIHADAADRHGNVLIVDGRRDTVPADIILARAAKKVIVTVEQIVSERTVAARPQDQALLADDVTVVVEAPYGAHPTGFSNRYRADEDALSAFQAAGAAETSFAGWLDEWVEGPAGHMAYLEKLGTRRLMEIALSRRTALR